MPLAKQQPHRPGPLHQTNKTHKSGRHARKSSATSEVKNKSSVKPLSTKQYREDRLNQAHQTRQIKRERAIEEKRKLGTESQPPIVVGVLDLHQNSCSSFFNRLRDFNDATLKVSIVNLRTFYVTSTKLRMRFKLVALDAEDFDETLDIVKSLDFMLLFYRPETVGSQENPKTAWLLQAIHIHCLPKILHVIDGTVQDGNNFQKSLMNAKRALRSRINEEKVHVLEKDQDFIQLFHVIGTYKRQRSQFKENRSTIVTDKVEVLGNSLTFTGFVRHKILSPNDLVHIVGYGDHQIKQIDILPDPVSLRPCSMEGSQVVQTLLPDSMKQETLELENDIDPMEGEQTWPTAEELVAEAERRNTRKIIKRLPPGTSSYQGAWIGDDSGEELDSSEEENDEVTINDPMEEDEEDKEVYETASNDELTNDVQEGMELENYDEISKDKELKILEKLRESRLEEMFPDEVDTPGDVPARFRFARYRGLKSFRTSHWDHGENLPPDYSRIFQFQNFHRTKRRVLSEVSKEGADPGQYVRLHLANVCEEIRMHILSKIVPPTIVGLLKYERKMTVMNLLIKRLQGSNLCNPIKSKEELIFYVGFRKFKARPLFTNHSVSSKFKNERFLRDDVAMVATVYAPITFPPAPVLVFRTNYRGEKEPVASGSVLDSNPNRLIIKRIRLSGHPFKIHSKSAVIRFMFFNNEDVMYFKPVELTSKYNRRGHITEALGTHGHMKCIFDKKIRSDDCILMNLYKRVFPKWTYAPIYEM